MKNAAILGRILTCYNHFNKINTKGSRKNGEKETGLWTGGASSDWMRSDWIYVELTEFDSELPPITDPDDLVLSDNETLRNISVNIRLTDGWDE